MSWLVHHPDQQTAYPKDYYYSKEAASRQRKLGRSSAGTDNSSQSAKDNKCEYLMVNIQ